MPQLRPCPSQPSKPKPCICYDCVRAGLKKKKSGGSRGAQPPGGGGGGAEPPPPIPLRFKLAVFLHFSPQTISRGFFSCFFSEPTFPLPSCSPPHPQAWCSFFFPNLRTRPPPRHAYLSSKGSRGAQPPCAVRDFDNSVVIIIVIIIMIIVVIVCTICSSRSSSSSSSRRRRRRRRRRSSTSSSSSNSSSRSCCSYPEY